MVYIQTKTDFSCCNEWAIVDGQQRLTTIFLLLYAIKNHLLVQKDNDAAAKSILYKITYFYLENMNVKYETYKLRLKPLVSNDAEFKRIANNQAAEDKKSLIRKNYNDIEKQIKI